jgi:hypothetical protein
MGDTPIIPGRYSCHTRGYSGGYLVEWTRLQSLCMAERPAFISPSMGGSIWEYACMFDGEVQAGWVAQGRHEARGHPRAGVRCAVHAWECEGEVPCHADRVPGGWGLLLRHRQAVREADDDELRAQEAAPPAAQLPGAVLASPPPRPPPRLPYQEKQGPGPETHTRPSTPGRARPNSHPEQSQHSIYWNL